MSPPQPLDTLPGFDNGSGREPLKVEVVVRDPEAGETIREVVTHHPPEGAEKNRCFYVMMEDVSERVMKDLERIYDGSGVVGR